MFRRKKDLAQAAAPCRYKKLREINIKGGYDRETIKALEEYLFEPVLKHEKHYSFSADTPEGSKKKYVDYFKSDIREVNEFASHVVDLEKFSDRFPMVNFETIRTIHATIGD